MWFLSSCPATLHPLLLAVNISAVLETHAEQGAVLLLLLSPMGEQNSTALQQRRDTR